MAAVLGGAKVSDKIGILKNLIPRVDLILVGGAMAYTFLAARGIAVGRSLLEKDFLGVAREILDAAAAAGVPFLLPVDHVVAEDTAVEEPAVTADESVPAERMALDIGPRTAALFAERLQDPAVTLWNGPLGLFEREPYRHGTVAVAKALAALRRHHRHRRRRHRGGGGARRGPPAP